MAQSRIAKTPGLDSNGVATLCLCHWIAQVMMRLSKSLKTGMRLTRTCTKFLENPLRVRGVSMT